jgi:hypothetical protein
MTDNTQSKALRMALDLEALDLDDIAAELRRLNQSEREGWRHADELEQERKRLHAEIADLRAHLVAVGACGAVPLMGAGDAGWVMVPKEPTLSMGWAYLDAARESEPLRTHLFNHDGYRAMIAAAPSSAKGVAHG